MDDRRNMWKSFTRRDGCFRITWVSRKTLVISIFVPCIIIGVIIGFTFPRVPSFGIDSKSPLKSAAGTDFNDSIPISFERAPAATFNFPAFAHLQVTTQSSYVPLTFSHLYAEVTELETFRKVATGDLGHYKLLGFDRNRHEKKGALSPARDKRERHETLFRSTQRLVRIRQRPVALNRLSTKGGTQSQKRSEQI